MSLQQKIGQPFIYFSSNEGMEVQGQLSRVDEHNAYMSDGTVIPKEFFNDIAVSANGGDSIENNDMIIDPNSSSQSNPPQQNNIKDPYFNIGVDENGFPILDTNEAAPNNDVITPSNNNIADRPPLRANSKTSTTEDHGRKGRSNDASLPSLLDNAKKKTKKISISLEIDTIDTKLVRLLSESFGEESRESVIEYMVNSLSMDDVRSAIKTRISKMYVPPKSATKKVVEESEDGNE